MHPFLLILGLLAAMALLKTIAESNGQQPTDGSMAT